MNECIVNTEFIRKLLVISHFRFKYWGCSEQWNRRPTPVNYWRLNDNFFPTLYYLHQIMPALGQCFYSNYNSVSVIKVEHFITFEIIYLSVFLMFILASLVLERWHCIKKKCDWRKTIRAKNYEKRLVCNQLFAQILVSNDDINV